MHLLYLDDSGSPINPNEEYFVLGGISVPETSVRWLSYELEKVARQYDPSCTNDVELHAAEIFSGRSYPWNSMVNKNERIGAIQKVLHALDSANQNLVAFACAVHKPSFPHEDVVIHAYEEITSRFDRYLQRISDETGTPQRGAIILDKSSYETGLQNLASQIRRTGNRWGSYTSAIVEVPLFIDSRASRNVQLADHIAYSVFRRYNANDLTYINVIENRFDTREGVICGLVHKISSYRTCTCPACITRPNRRARAISETN
jgi:hypothetical protein